MNDLAKLHVSIPGVNIKNLVNSNIKRSDMQSMCVICVNESVVIEENSQLVLRYAVI